jgi:ankyrin repeat protein
MKERIKLITFFMMILLASNSFGQTAIDFYNAAKKSADLGDYESALKQIYNCQSMLKGSNAKLESMKFQILLAKGDQINAAVAFRNYDVFLSPELKQSTSYAAMQAQYTELLNQLNSEKVALENQVKEKANQDLLVAQQLKNDLILNNNQKLEKLNRENDLRLSQAISMTKDSALIALYEKEIGPQGQSWKQVMLEKDKRINPNKYLEAAVKSNEVSEFNDLIGFGANINLKNSAGETMLHVAIQHDSRAIFSLLILNHADISQVNQELIEPLSYSLFYDKTYYFDQLLEITCSLKYTKKEDIVEKLRLPLFYSLFYNKMECLMKIEKKGIDLTKPISIKLGKFTPIEIVALYSKSVTLGKYLIQKGISVNQLSGSGMGLLTLAIQPTEAISNSKQCCLNFINFLLESGCDIDQKNASGSTVLHEVVNQNETELTSYLIERGGASKTSINSQGQTAYQFASTNNFLIAKEAIKHSESFIDKQFDRQYHNNMYLLKKEKQVINQENRAMPKGRRIFNLGLGTVLLTAWAVSATYMVLKYKEDGDPIILAANIPLSLIGILGFGSVVDGIKLPYGSFDQRNDAYTKRKTRKREINYQLRKNY